MDLEPIHDLLKKDMDRKGFLMHVGGTMLTLVGIGGIIKAITNPSSKHSSKGYGSSPYGR